MEYRKIEELVLLHNNPRTITDSDFETLKQSIKKNKKFFEARPIIISNRTGELVVLGGNQRLRAAKDLKLKEVPTFLIEGLSELEEKEIVVRDNVNNGKWDWDILANEWETENLNEWGLAVWNPSDSLFDVSGEEEDVDVSPTITDNEHSKFELIMIHENKKELLHYVNQIKKERGLESQEEVMMLILKFYLDNYGK